MAVMLRSAGLWLGLVLLLSSHGAIAERSEDLCGKNFVFAFPPNLHPSSNEFQVVLTSCSSASRTTVNISTPSHDIQYFSTQFISNSESLTVTLPGEIADEREVFFIHGTVLISSDHDITVVAVSGQKRTMASFPIIPTTSLGQEYVVITYVNEVESTGLPAEFAISSLSENTHVTIQLSNDALPSNDWSVQYSADEQVELDLFSYDSVLFRSAEGLTGTQIRSDKPISVVAGSACIFVPNDLLACDHIVEHIPPVNRWGSRYIVPPFMGRQSGYVYRVVAARDETRITYQDKESRTIVIDKGEFIERNIEEDYTSLVTADKPILVAQFAKGNFTDGIGDPAMLIVTPIEQYVSQVAFSTFNVSAHDIENEYLTVITLCDHLDNLRLNGMSLEVSDGSMMRVDVLTDYCVLRRPLWTKGYHKITSVSLATKFTAFQYGFGIRIAYAHPVAFGLKKITCKGYDKRGGEKEQNANHKIQRSPCLPVLIMPLCTHTMAEYPPYPGTSQLPWITQMTS
ncbi:IgGFc-binding protein-like [Amphiura filiformis]|uniref:IgGFc-binding protein-like n=1 Tax=Amphiura filiformis TaxID=82378 RepID=UPI003B226AA4